jgi:hypothetical protein
MMQVEKQTIDADRQKVLDNVREFYTSWPAIRDAYLADRGSRTVLDVLSDLLYTAMACATLTDTEAKTLAMPLFDYPRWRKEMKEILEHDPGKKPAETVIVTFSKAEYDMLAEFAKTVTEDSEFARMVTAEGA